MQFFSNDINFLDLVRCSQMAPEMVFNWRDNYNIKISYDNSDMCLWLEKDIYSTSYFAYHFLTYLYYFTIHVPYFKTFNTKTLDNLKQIDDNQSRSCKLF